MKPRRSHIFVVIAVMELILLINFIAFYAYNKNHDLSMQLQMFAAILLFIINMPLMVQSLGSEKKNSELYDKVNQILDLLNCKESNVNAQNPSNVTVNTSYMVVIKNKGITSGWYKSIDDVIAAMKEKFIHDANDFVCIEVSGLNETLYLDKDRTLSKIPVNWNS